MTSALPSVSVVIPCWNAEHTVGEAIASALHQTYQGIVEVIVVDNGSVDASLSVIKSFEKRIRWETGSNRGACAARNRGTDLAHGALIQFLDADDVLLPDKLEKQVPHTLAGGPSNMSISLGTTRGRSAYFDWQYGRLYTAGRDPVDFVLNGLLPTAAPLHFRENLVAVGGFDESLPCAQEFDLHLRLVSNGLGIIQIRETLFVVRHQPNSVSSDFLRVKLQKHHISSQSTDHTETTRRYDT